MPREIAPDRAQIEAKLKSALSQRGELSRTSSRICALRGQQISCDLGLEKACARCGTALAPTVDMAHLNRLRVVAVWFGTATLLALVSGCYADAGAEPEYVEASAAPVDVAVAPHYVYEGRTVYYSNDRWYARDRGRWVYYRHEPQPLYRQRTHVQEAPRARDERRVARPREEAPRAGRVQ